MEIQTDKDTDKYCENREKINKKKEGILHWHHNTEELLFHYRFLESSPN